jgi:hypothetical protein
MITENKTPSLLKQLGFCRYFSNIVFSGMQAPTNQPTIQIVRLPPLLGAGGFLFGGSPIDHGVDQTGTPDP